MKSQTARPKPARKKPGKERSGLRKQATGHLAEQRNLQIAVLALVGLVLICYANSLGNAFVFDDLQVVLIDGRPTSFAHLLQMLTSSYRPIRNLSYALDFGVWGASPFGVHLTNIIIHAGNTLLVFWLVRRISGNRLLVSFLAAAIFAVHPIQTDAVTYISGRRDVLFSLFYIASLHAYLSFRKSRSLKHAGLFVGLWVLSLMTKEMAVSLPAVIFVWNFCEAWGEQTGSKLRRSIEAARKAFAADKWLYIALIAAAAAYAWYQTYMVGASLRSGYAGLRYWGGGFFETVLMMLRVHAWYLKQLVFPTPIAQYYGAFDFSTSLLDWRVLASLALIGSILAAAFALVGKNKAMAFAIFSYFAMLLPVSQIIPHHELLADHYLYLPMMAFGLLVALTAERFSGSKTNRQFVYVASGALILSFSVMTVLRNSDWKDEFTVSQANYEAVPNSPRAAYNLANQYLERDAKKAEALLREALANDPGYLLTYVTLGQILVSQNRTREAEDLIQQGFVWADNQGGYSFVQQPLWFRSKLSMLLGGAKWQQGDRARGEQLLREAIALYASNLEAYDVLANCYASVDRSKEEGVLKEGVSVAPAAYDMQARLVSLLIEDKKFAEALPYLAQMSQLKPSAGDCKKVQRYISAAKSATSEAREYTEALRAALRPCEQ
ncbi:MAG: tetratricopeptide repeat protein [Acidobacteriota bacterium]